MADNKKNKTSEAQLEASKRYRERNPEAFRRIDYKSKAKMFVKNYATDEEMLYFISLYNDRIEQKESKMFLRKLTQKYLSEYGDNDDLIYLIQQFNNNNRNGDDSSLIDILKKE